MDRNFYRALFESEMIALQILDLVTFKIFININQWIWMKFILEKKNSKVKILKRGHLNSGVKVDREDHF